MSHILDQPLPDVARALREGEISAADLAAEAVRRHERLDARLHAYKTFDADAAMARARAADARLERHRRGLGEAPPLCGIPVSVKDLYGVEGFPTFAGTARRLPGRWERDAWLVARVREQGAVFTGKTHTVELAYGAVGLNPHWGTPRNPWDLSRVPGGSSSGAGVSLHEGSALVALGSDTGGSIRIPASMTGVVGHKTTRGRWPTDGVVPLSHTLDTVGALTRSAVDAAYFFGAVDPGARTLPAPLQPGASPAGDARLRMGLPHSALWRDCQGDVAAALVAALEALEAAGWARVGVEGRLLDEAADLYMTGVIAGAECRAVVREELPEWEAILDPVVGSRLAAAPAVSDTAYGEAQEERVRMAAAAGALFAECDVLVLPAAIATPPLVEDVAEDALRYRAANVAALRPTCPANVLGLCALTLPVGLDEAGMPVGLQLVAPRDADERLLQVAVAAERVLGTARERLGRPPGVA